MSYRSQLGFRDGDRGTHTSRTIMSAELRLLLDYVTADAGSRRELSIFQLGLRWLKRCMVYQPDRIPPFRARISPNKIKTIVKPKPLSG